MTGLEPELIAESVAKDGPVECYRKGYEEGYEAGKRVADASLYAKGWQDCFAELKAKFIDSFGHWGMEAIPARNDGGAGDAG